MIKGLDHLQLTMPAGEEEAVRAFATDLLGLEELPKPETLIARGGVWYKLPDGREIHFGVENDFLPARKAHPALICADLDTLAERLADAAYPVIWDDLLAPRRRFYTADPFGNRLEFITER